jgi:Fe-S-cluster containining protein
MLTPADLKQVRLASQPQRHELAAIYSRLPQTNCRRQALCCTLLPEVSFLEGLQAIQKMQEMPSALRLDLSQKLIRYFFVNPVKITYCPFLQDQECLIYADRPFGCRAYGLWSKKFYRQLFEQNRQAKLLLGHQWEKLGVTLPAEVVEFQVPYCSFVCSDSFNPMSDAFLLNAWDDIDKLSQTLQPGHHLFQTTFFSDLSFLFVGMTFGPTKAVHFKVQIVQEMIQSGYSKRLEQLVAQCPDL